VTASDGSLWIMGLDEMNDTVSMNFQQVLKPLRYDTNGGASPSEEELSKQEQAQEPYILTGGEKLKKGYFSVAMISSCRQLVFDIALKNGVARLHEIGLDYRREGKIIDFSMGFRHCLVITETEEDEGNGEGTESVS
jgi:hypothetical protein